MKSTARAVTLSVVTLVGLGCAGSVQHMTAVPNVNYAATANEAVVIFMRPSGMGFAIQSSVFEVPDGQPARLVGIVAAKKKLAYRTTPGDHMFMTIGESADFMQARLEPGKVYYALVTPRMGAWKARFSLRPVHVADRAELASWQSGTEWVQTNEDTMRWAAENSADVEAKRAKYFPEWMEKLPADRPVLVPEDGQ
jgi:hypothetical protein